jgi:hypothetical protein
MGCGIVNLKTQVIGEKSKNKIRVSKYDRNNNSPYARCKFLKLLSSKKAA